MGREETEMLKNHPARKWKDSEMHLLLLPVKKSEADVCLVRCCFLL